MEGTFWFLYMHIENSYIKFTVKTTLFHVAGTDLQEVLLTQFVFSAKITVIQWKVVNLKYVHFIGHVY